MVINVPVPPDHPEHKDATKFVTMSGLKYYNNKVYDRFIELQKRVEYLEKICSAYFIK